jgi:hypothetical protein
MDLKELSESVQQQSAPVPLISPKRQIRSRFQLNLDKTIESCKAQLGASRLLALGGASLWRCTWREGVARWDLTSCRDLHLCG